MRTTLVTLALFSALSAFSQEFSTHYYGATKGSDLTETHTASLPDGGLIIAGNTNTANSGGSHAMLIRTDSNGVQLWQRQYFSGTGLWVEPTTDGGFILCGNKLKEPFGTYDGFVVKVNSAGVEEWSRPIGPELLGTAVCVRQLKNGYLVVCGNVLHNKFEGQDIYLLELDPYGYNIAYIEKGDPFVNETAAEIYPLADNGVALLWYDYFNPSPTLTRFSNDLTIRWETDLNKRFAYHSKPDYVNVLQNHAGNFLVAGGYNSDLSTPVRPQILQISDYGNLINRQDVPFDSRFKLALQLTPGNASYCYFLMNNKLGRVTLDAGGNLVGQDTFPTGSADFSNKIVLQANRTAYLFQYLPEWKNDIQVHILSLSGASPLPVPRFTLTTGLAVSDEYYLSSCPNNENGYYVLEGKPSADGTFFEYHVIKTDDSGQTIAEATIDGDANPQVTWNIQQTTDGGAIVGAGNFRVWKINRQLEVQWVKLFKYNPGLIITDKSNGFAIVHPYAKTANGESTSSISEYDSEGNLKWERTIPPLTNYCRLTGGTCRPDGGFTLWGKEYSYDSQYWKNWIVYLNENGDVMNSSGSNVVLKEYDVEPQSTRSLEGVVYTAAQTDKTRLHLLGTIGDKVVWDTAFYCVEDSQRIRLRRIETIPCAGVVVIYDEYPVDIYGLNLFAASGIVTKLLYFDEYHRFQKSFSFKTLPVLSSTDTTFVAGYTYHQWGSQINGQTSDIYHKSVHFPANPLTYLRAGKLFILPNPSPGQSCLQYESGYQGLLEVDLFNMEGRLVDHFRSEKTGPIWMFNYLTNQKAGNYVFRIRVQGGADVVQRFTVCR
jgi:hypothetical protein